MWKPISGFEALYEVSDSGQVRSLTRIITDKAGHSYQHQGKVIKPNKIKNGYLVVYLRKEGRTYPKYVHRLVAEAFVPNPNNFPIVNHLNGNKQNCNAPNLEWATYSRNNQHAYDTGLKLCGEHQFKARLTESEVIEIRKNGKYTTYENIAKKYNVSKATIRDVLVFKTWRGVA